MSTVTPFLNLVKPAPLEAFSRATYNNNLDLIDAGTKAAVERTGVAFGHMGRTANFQGVGGAGVTTIIMDAAQELLGGFTFDNAADALVIPKTGRYCVRLKGFFTGAATGLNQVGIKVNGVTTNGIQQGCSLHVSKMDGNDVYSHSSQSIRFNLGDKIAVWVNTGVSTWGTNGYDGSYLELLYEGDW